MKNTFIFSNYFFCLMFFLGGSVVSDVSLSAQKIQRRSLLSSPKETPSSVEPKDVKVKSPDQSLGSKKLKEKPKRNKKVKTKPVAKVMKKPKKNLEEVLDIDDLPKVYDGWVLSLQPGDASNKVAYCQLRSRLSKINDGLDDTALDMRINSEQIVFTTDSSIDFTHSGIGLTIDNQYFFPVNYGEYDTRAVLNFYYDELIKKVSSAKRMSVKLGFWPYSKLGKVYSTDMYTGGLSQGIVGLQACEKAVSLLHS